MDKPLISVIVPVYGVEEYLDDCMESLTHQTYTNMEFILIDDGSKDRSPEICDEWSRKDQRVRVFHTENHGVSHARNLGLDKAQGDYIGFFDPDDWCDLSTYEDMLSYIQKNKADIHIGGYVIEHRTGSEITLTVGTPTVLSSQKVLQEMFSINYQPRFNWSLCDKLISHSLVEKIRFDESLKLSEDQWFFWQLLKKVNRVSYAPQMAYHYRMREGSATHTSFDIKNGTYIDAMKRILDDAQDMDEKIKHLLQMKYWQISISVLKKIILSGNHDGDEILMNEQNELRKNFFTCFTERGISKLGVMYMILPYKIIWLLRPLLLKVKS